MDTQLAGAQALWREMIALGNDYAFEPSVARSNQVYQLKTLMNRCALAVVTSAMEVSGGGSFFRSAGLERMFRDIQGARFHPFQEKKQFVFSGRIALGLQPV